MTLFALTILLPLVIVSSRIYEVKLSVDDDHTWQTFSNASVYFILITERQGDYIETPAYIVESGLPDSKTYTYSLLLDDIGEPHALRLMHTNANILCVDWISVNDMSVTADQRDHDCRSSELYECQQITAYFQTQTITHIAGTNAAYGCNWNAVMQRGLLKEYNIEIQLDTSHDVIFYNDIGLLLEGFTYNNYYLPYFNFSSDLAQIEDFWVYDRIDLNIISYDITPIQSLIITSQNAESFCIKRVEISVTNVNNKMVKLNKIFDESECISYPGFNGCNVMTLDLKNDISFQKTQLPCNIIQTSFIENKANIPETAEYVLTIEVSEATSDYVFYQMEGHNGERTECFNTAGFQLPEGQSDHRYGYMRNIGNPKKLYLMHDRDDDICIDSISIQNYRTNDTIIHNELMCSNFLYNKKQTGRCNVIEINFETNNATNIVYKRCPWNEICEFGLYEDPYASNGMSSGEIIAIIFFIIFILFLMLSFIFGYQRCWCNCVYLLLYNCWDPFVNKLWNPKYENKCFHCKNTTEMQRNLCCHCCGCNYCDPFSAYRKRMEKKGDQIGNDETGDIDEIDRFNLTTAHDKDMYDMNAIDNVDLGDNVKIAGNGTHTKKNDEDDVGEISVDFDDSDSAELQLKGNKNNYSHLNNDVEDAPINMGMYDDNDDINTAVVDQYDNPTLR